MSATRMEQLKFIDAHGPEQLREVLDTLLEQTEKLHYIHYQNGNQKSFIKVDLNKDQPYFWYCDLQGRTIPRGVQTTIADFLWEKLGYKEKYLASAAPEFNHKQDTPKISKSPFGLFSNLFGKQASAPKPADQPGLKKK